MFTGIIEFLRPISIVDRQDGRATFSIDSSNEMLNGLKVGASVAIDGVCLTVVRIEGNHIWFDAIGETLRRTTIDKIYPGREVNVERSFTHNDEVGGHILSGHVYGTSEIVKVDTTGNNHVKTFKCPPDWMKYIFTKGFIALDGASLTIVDTDNSGLFTVHFIPETLRKTAFGRKKVGDTVNLEFDFQTQAIVDRVEPILDRVVEQAVKRILKDMGLINR